MLDHHKVSVVVLAVVVGTRGLHSAPEQRLPISIVLQLYRVGNLLESPSVKSEVSLLVKEERKRIGK